VGQYNPNEFQPGYGGVINSEGNVVNIGDLVTPDGKVKIDLNEAVELTVSDIQIGAVEIKDESTNNRMKVNSDGSLNFRVVGSIDGGVW
jgi:hypothetical protein